MLRQGRSHLKEADDEKTVDVRHAVGVALAVRLLRREDRHRAHPSNKVISKPFASSWLYGLVPPPTAGYVDPSEDLVVPHGATADEVRKVFSRAADRAVKTGEPVVVHLEP